MSTHPGWCVTADVHGDHGVHVSKGIVFAADVDDRLTAWLVQDAGMVESPHIVVDGVSDGEPVSLTLSLGLADALRDVLAGLLGSSTLPAVTR